MSRIALAIKKTTFQTDSQIPMQPASRSGEYLDLIGRLFRGRSVVAIVGAGPGSRSDEACIGIAAEIAACGKHVVIVRVDALLKGSSVPVPTVCLSAAMSNISLWPSAATSHVELFPSSHFLSSESDWLSGLRQEFDAVILDCPPCGSATAVPEIAALADAAVLVAAAGITENRQIRRDQKLLEIRGVKLVGCVLMERR